MGNWQGAAWRIRQMAALKRVDKEALLNKAASKLADLVEGLDAEGLAAAGGYAELARIVIGQQPGQGNNELNMPTNQRWWIWNWLTENRHEIINRAKNETQS